MRDGTTEGKEKLLAGVWELVQLNIAVVFLDKVPG